ncbi:unnamed protein product [Chrysodeixis includens]|uniref:MD-2-related lipid-recognition domain-containing protein n=1 Tax=Chrysodeixis includens TaxID=689277 RepID=A0A9P0BY85_CHRIL|nr:unnamed protein product [Chrysodeixis includens]
MFRLVVLFAAVALAAGEVPQVYQKCNVNADLPVSASVSGCNQAPCLLPQGQDFALTINFNTPSEVSSMRTQATLFLKLNQMFLPLPYPLGDNEVTCNHLTSGQCPAAPGDNLQQVLRIPVESVFPVGVESDIEVRVVDEQRNSLVCLRVPVKVVGPVEA